MNYLYKTLLLLVIFISVVVTQTVSKEETTELTNPTEYDLRRISQFSFEFYQKLFNEHENFIMSPLSIRILLFSIYAAAKSTSRSELKSIAHLRSSEKILFFDPIMKENDLNIFNKAYYKDGIELKHKFKNHLKHLNFLLERINFKNNQVAADEINGWIKTVSNNMIDEIISADDIGSDMELILLNAIHFKSNWIIPFCNSQTHKRMFSASNGNKYEIDMMSQYPADLRFGVVKELKSKILEIPYVSNFVMWILLPDRDNSLATVSGQLNSETMQKLNDTLKMNRVSIEIPKFSIESAVDAKKALQLMGLTSIFTKYDLDIAIDDYKKVGDIQQKAKIIVNEEGTEAGATSRITILTRTYIEYPEFNANRPFIFMIVQKDTLVPIFLGHYSVPPGDPKQVLTDYYFYSDY